MHLDQIVDDVVVLLQAFTVALNDGGHRADNSRHLVYLGHESIHALAEAFKCPLELRWILELIRIC